MMIIIYTILIVVGTLVLIKFILVNSRPDSPEKHIDELDAEEDLSVSPRR